VLVLCPAVREQVADQNTSQQSVYIQQPTVCLQGASRPSGSRTPRDASTSVPTC